MESLTEQLSSQKFHDSLIWDLGKGLAESKEHLQQRKDQMIVDAERKIIEKVKASFNSCETKGIVFDKLLSSQTVAELGVVIFNALDFGLKVPLLIFFNWNLI